MAQISGTVEDTKNRDFPAAHCVTDEVARKLRDRPAPNLKRPNPTLGKKTARVRKAADLLNSVLESRQEAIRKLERDLVVEILVNLEEVSSRSRPVLHLQRCHRLPGDLEGREAALARA